MLQVPTNEKREQHSITIPAHLWLFAKRVGRDNASAGITFILEQAARNEQKEPTDTKGDS